jgi:glycosyltransferase involved in cell wall biosynthesis
VQVLHIISNRDNSGGTIAAMNLHHALLEAGYQSSILSTDKLTGSLTGKGYRRFGGVIGRIQQFFLKAEDSLARPGFINPTDKLVVDKALRDYNGIVHIHVTHVSQISFDLLNWLSYKHKVFWTLHDLWPLTAKCIHPTYCQKWHTGCYNCPKLSEYPSLKWDNTPYLYQQKQEFISRNAIHFIAPSEWINDLAHTLVTKLGSKISTIPHSIDNAVFKPADKRVTRKEFNLRSDGELILFPQGRWDDPKKGLTWYSALKNTLMLNLSGKTHYFLIRIDGEVKMETELTPFLTEITLPKTTDKKVMAKYYQLADLSVSLSEIETFGLCVAESLACGVPVVARRANGIDELLAYNDSVLAGTVEEMADLILQEKWKSESYQELFQQKNTNVDWAQKHITLYES